MRKCFLAIFFLVFSSQVFAAEFSDFIVAKVNNKAIADSEVNDRYRFVMLTAKMNIKDANDKKVLRQQIIDKMIDEEVIRQEAKNLKIEVAEKELKESIDLVASHYKKTPAQFKKFLEQNKLSFESYSNQVEAEVLWSKIIGDFLRSKVKVSDTELKEFFEQSKLSSDVRKFLLAEIVISQSTNSAKFAEKLTEELRRGADFKALAEQFSSGVEQEIGWVSQADIDEKIYTAIAKLGKGGYSDPVKLNDGYHIFKVVDSKSEQKIAEQDLGAAKNIIFSRKLQTLAKGHLMDLRKKAFIEVD